MKNQSRHVRANYFFRELPVTTKPLIASAKVAFKLGGAILIISPPSVFHLARLREPRFTTPPGARPNQVELTKRSVTVGLVKKQNHGIGAGGPRQFSIECSPTKSLSRTLELLRGCGPSVHIKP